MNIANHAGRSFGALLAQALAVLSAPGQADDAIHLDFMTHASFFSAETHQAAQDVTQVRERAPGSFTAIPLKTRQTPRSWHISSGLLRRMV